MKNTDRPFVHKAINAVDAVLFDPEGIYDPEVHDRYETFTEARDAALTSVEVLLDEADYDGEDHREELERMLLLLENSENYQDLAAQPGYRWFLGFVEAEKSLAA